MLRALSLSPCASFSPELLRTEPAALAAWIRYRFLRWLLNAPLRASHWTYRPDGPNPHIVVDGVTGGRIVLERDGVTLPIEYKFSGLAFEMGLPVPFPIMQTLPNAKGTAAYWVKEGDKHADGADLAALGVTPSCLVVDLALLCDSLVARRGGGTNAMSGAVLLLGVEESLRAHLSKLGVYTARLRQTAESSLPRNATYTPGILRADWTPVDRSNAGGADVRAIQEDVELIFSQHAFRGALFFPGVKGGNAAESPGIFVGHITNAPKEEKGTIGADVAREALKAAVGLVGKGPQAVQSAARGKLAEAAAAIEQKTGIKSEVAKSAVDFAVKHAGENPATLAKSAADVAGGKIIQKTLADHPNIAAVAVALTHAATNGANLKSLAASGAQVPAVRKVFNELGQKTSIPAPATNFLVDHAQALATGDWKSLAVAGVQSLGGNQVAGVAAGVALEKMMGQPVSSWSVAGIGAQGVKALLDKGPVVAVGSGGAAAVTNVTGNQVEVHDGVAPAQKTPEQFATEYETVVAPEGSEP